MLALRTDMKGLGIAYSLIALGFASGVRAQNVTSTPTEPITIADPPNLQSLGVLMVEEMRRSLLSSLDPLQVCLLEADGQENSDCPDVNVVTKDTISQTDITIPSLWWADQQFGNKLLENWLAYPDKRRVDLVVNRQRWSLLDYLQRYEFVNHMGTVMREEEYNLRVFNRREPHRPLAAYTCNFNLIPYDCEIHINSGARPSFQESDSKRGL